MSFRSVAQSCLTLCDPMDCSTPGLPVPHHLLEFAQCDALEKGMASHFSILNLRTPWTLWKDKKIGHWKMNSPGQTVPNMLPENRGEKISERMKRQNQGENNNHRKLIKLITWTTVLSNSMKLWAMPCRATQDGRVMVEKSEQNVVHWRRQWQTTSVFLPWEPHAQYEKVKR